MISRSELGVTRAALASGVMGQHEGSVELRAFRGTRKSSVYRDHIVPAREFGRVVVAAARDGLSLLPSLDVYGRRSLDKAEAKQLAEEATDLRMSGRLADLDEELTAIAEVARWCAHASGNSWLMIVGP